MRGVCCIPYCYDSGILRCIICLFPLTMIELVHRIGVQIDFFARLLWVTADNDHACNTITHFTLYYNSITMFRDIIIYYINRQPSSVNIFIIVDIIWKWVKFFYQIQNLNSNSDWIIRTLAQIQLFMKYPLKIS